MADRKITGHTAITAAQVDPTADVFEIVDVSDTTDAASGTNKKMTFGDIMGFNSFVKTTRYIYLPGFTNVTPSTAAAAGNILRLVPFVLYNKISISNIACEVTTGTSGKIRLGIYEDNGSGAPSTLLVDSGELTITAPGVYSSNISLTLYRGLYWIGYLTDTGNTFRSITGGSFPNVMGWGLTIGANFQGNAWTHNQTYGALPNPAPTSSPGVNTSNQPIVACIIS